MQALLRKLVEVTMRTAETSDAVKIHSWNKMMTATEASWEADSEVVQRSALKQAQLTIETGITLQHGLQDRLW